MAYPSQIDVVGTATDFYPYPYGAPPVIIGTSIFQALVGRDDAFSSTVNINVYKSTDNGNTWTLPTSTGRPTPVADDSGHYGAKYQAIDTDTNMWFVYCNSDAIPTQSHLQNFDTANGTWNTVINGGPAPWDSLSNVIGSSTYTLDPQIPNDGGQLGLNIRSNGDKVVIYNAATVASTTTLKQSLYFQVYNGTWGAAIPLMIAGTGTDTTDQLGMSFSYSGSVLGTNDIIHVFAWTEAGYAYASITTANAVANYRRFDNDELDLTGGKQTSVWGYPKIVHMCDKRYAALPHGLLTTVERDTGDAVNNHLRPALLMIPDVATPQHTRYEIVEDQIEMDGYSWVPVAVTCDTSAKSTYLVWHKLATPASSYATQIRMSCSNGVYWTDPQTLVTTADPDIIETIEVEAEGGRLHCMFEESEGAGVYTYPQYYQFSVSCADEGCGGTSTVTSGSNYAFVG